MMARMMRFSTGGADAMDDEEDEEDEDEDEKDTAAEEEEVASEEDDEEGCESSFLSAQTPMADTR